MLKTATKKYISEHIQQEEKESEGTMALGRFALSFFMLLMPFFIYKHFYGAEIPATIAMLISVAIISFFITWWLNKRTKKLPSQFEATAEVLTIKTSRVIKRLSGDENDSSYYIDILHEGVSKVLFLNNLFIQEKESSMDFPNTWFEIIRHQETEEILEIRTKGRPLKPEMALPPFTAADYEKNRVPEDCEILEINIDQVK